MATLKLKKPPAPGRSGRAPVRASGPKARPTLAQAQAQARPSATSATPPRAGAARRTAAVQRPRPPRPRPRKRRAATSRSAAAQRNATAAPQHLRNQAPQRPRGSRPQRPGSASSRSSAPGRHATSEPRPQRPPRAAAPATAQPSGSMRLSKRMSELGIASRREADEWIPKGWVRVDGRVVSELGSRVLPEQQITIDAKARFQQAQRVTVLLNKPIGWVSGQAEDGYEPAIVLVKPQTQWREDHSGIRFLPEHLRNLAPAGRLDIDSVGLLVLTQDGRIARQLIGEDSEVEKEYLVRVEPAAGEPLSAAGLALLNHGLELDGEALEAGARRVGQRRPVALRAARRQEAPDPPHVRGGGAEGDGPEARAHRQGRARRPAVRAVALPAARRAFRLSGGSARHACARSARRLDHHLHPLRGRCTRPGSAGRPGARARAAARCGRTRSRRARCRRGAA